EEFHPVWLKYFIVLREIIISEWHDEHLKVSGRAPTLTFRIMPLSQSGQEKVSGNNCIYISIYLYLIY
ncbi:MAG: hypothetical protein ACFFDT_04985, partial [Candidatus Hodarchaeota archaeon]